MSMQCKERVSDRTGFYVSRCSRKAVVDGYCKQHSPEAVKARREKADKLYKEKMELSDWKRLQIARERIAELEADNTALKDQVLRMEAADILVITENEKRLTNRIAELEAANRVLESEKLALQERIKDSAM